MQDFEIPSTFAAWIKDTRKRRASEQEIIQEHKRNEENYFYYFRQHQYLPCTLKDDISYLLPTWLSAGTGKLKRKHHFIGWQERTNKMKNKSCATNFATQQPFSLLLLLQEPFLLAERKKMCYLSIAANQSQYTNINSFILGYIY